MLHDFHDGLEAAPKGSALALLVETPRPRVVHGEHAAIADIRVVGDGNRITAGPRLGARILEQVPKLPFALGIHVADGAGGHCGISEDHVSVKVRTHPQGTVFEGDKRGALTGLASIVPILGRFNDLVPSRQAGRKAKGAILAAEVRLTRRPGVRDRESEGAIDGFLGRANGQAGFALVARRFRIRTKPLFAQELGVVGHRGEVQGPVDLDRARRPAPGVLGGQLHGVAKGVAVRIVGPHLDVVVPCVRAQRSVDMQVTEIGPAKRGSIPAGLGGFRARARRSAIVRGVGRVGTAAGADQGKAQGSGQQAVNSPATVRFADSENFSQGGRGQKRWSLRGVEWVE